MNKKIFTVKFAVAGVLFSAGIFVLAEAILPAIVDSAMVSDRKLGGPLDIENAYVGGLGA